MATGRVLLDWHSLDHVPLSDSYEPVPKRPDRPYDYFHVNSVSLAADGNLVISGRHTWTVYEVDRYTGRINWRLGGKQSDFRLGPGVRFAWQHDPVSTGLDTLRIFDNESNGRPVSPSSRIITVRLDRRRRTATLVRSIEFPGGLSVPSQGNSERLSNGDLFVGWGRVAASRSWHRTTGCSSTPSCPPATTPTVPTASLGPGTPPRDRPWPRGATAPAAPRSTPSGTAPRTSLAGASWPAPSRGR